MPAAQFTPLTVRQQVTLVPAVPHQVDRQVLGASRSTTRGPTIVLVVSGQTQNVRVNTYWGDAAVGPWFLAQQFVAAAGVPLQQKVRCVGAPWMRTELVNLGAVNTTPNFVVQEMIDLRSRP